jgi:hypothetical protein
MAGAETMPEDEKTRVLRGAKPVDRPPEPEDEGATRILQEPPPAKREERSGGKIVFVCPNGHRITVDGADAGKRGKCTKCGAAVVIPGSTPGPRPFTPPSPPTLIPPPPPLPGPALASRVVAQNGEGPGPDAEPAEPPFAIEPTASETTPEAAGDEDPESWNFIGGQVAADGPAAAEAVSWEMAGGGSPFGDEGGNPTAQLVARLWLERNHGGIIELHLEGGSVILPEWYDANWSRGTHGLFGSRAGESITITAVAWDTVQRVVVRQLTEMPDDMFT